MCAGRLLTWGVSFNEQTGTFSGTPTDIGEYIVPVHVETNYGYDDKDVKIIVEPHSYNVSAIGKMASTWSENATPDKYGFSPLQIPSTYKLSAVSNGFFALTSGEIPYCCGTYNVRANRIGFTDIYTMFVSSTTPRNLTEPHMINLTGAGFTGIERVVCGNSTYVDNSYTYISQNRKHVYVLNLTPLSFVKT